MPNKETIKDIKRDVKNARSLEAMANSEGGQIIIKSLIKDIDSAINSIIHNYKTAPESELRALGATLAVNYNLYLAFKNAPENVKFALQALEEEKSEDL